MTNDLYTQLDVGELFVITRGLECYRSDIILNHDGFNKQTDKNPHYDHSYDAMIFKVIEIAGPSVVTELVGRGENATPIMGKIGEKRLFNLTEIEIMPVTEAFLRSLTTTERIQKKNL